MAQEFKYLFQGERVYLDHNATTPIFESVAAQVPQWLENWGNPSSIHWAGRNPKALLRDTRKAYARALNCDPLEIIFTSGGSEANSLALRGYLSSSKNPHFISSSVEHPSIIKTLKHLSGKGVRVSSIAVDRRGRIDLEAYKSLLAEGVDLVSVMYANNETGHVFPIREMAAAAKAAGAVFHCDMVQALGKTPIDLKELGVDMASFSGHKFYALKGTGFLFVRKGLQLENLIFGGGQERHRRAGTENVLAIASMGEMAKHLPEVATQAVRIGELRDYLEQRILDEISNTQILGRDELRISNTSSLLIDGVDGETLLINLDMRGFAVSTGAACSSGSPEPSPVLLAMGLSREEAQSSLRLSLGWGTNSHQIDAFVENLKAVVTRLRSFSEKGSGYGI